MNIDQDKVEIWKEQFPTVNPLDVDSILDRRVVKRTKRKEYFEYLVKWKGHSINDVTWVDEHELQL